MDEKQSLREILSSVIGQTLSKKLNGQRDPDFVQARKDLNSLIQEWYGKPRAEMTKEELLDAIPRVRKLGDTIQRKESE